MRGAIGKPGVHHGPALLAHAAPSSPAMGTSRSLGVCPGLLSAGGGDGWCDQAGLLSHTSLPLPFPYLKVAGASSIPSEGAISCTPPGAWGFGWVEVSPCGFC